MQNTLEKSEYRPPPKQNANAAVPAIHLGSVQPMVRYVEDVAKWSTSEQCVESMVAEEALCIK